MFKIKNLNEDRKVEECHPFSMQSQSIKLYDAIIGTYRKRNKQKFKKYLIYKQKKFLMHPTHQVKKMSMYNDFMYTTIQEKLLCL